MRQGLIILAEDDLEMRALLVDSLARDGYEVIGGRDGLQMIEEIRMLLFRGDPMPIDLTQVPLAGHDDMVDHVLLDGGLRDLDPDLP